MTKNIMVLLKLLENGEVSASDFTGLEKGNVRHLPRIINDARRFVEIYTEDVVDKTTMETVGVKYILPLDQSKKLSCLIADKTDWQTKKKILSQKENKKIYKRVNPW